MKSPSLLAYFFACVFLLGVSFLFYPKWKIHGTEATISWDVSGYYWYLPAFIIYKDAKQLRFNEEIFKKYNPIPELQQAWKHPSGNYVMKYASGMAMQYLPFFLVAHALAEPLGYPADGFSEPYQLAVQLGGVLFAMLGLWFLRRVLLYYYKDNTVAIVLLLYVLGTNYLNYAAIDVGMTHSWLFSWYAILLYGTHHFYQNRDYKNALLIGFCIGIMALTRPTEIVAVLLPLFWGLNSFRKTAFRERWQFIKTHRTKYLAAALVTVLIGSIQLIYWQYATGNWLVYSYGNEGFDWLRPHVRQYMIGYRTGWLVYTPMMIFALIGFIPFVKNRQNVVPIVLFVLINTYIVVSWQTWWYGGRAMVQSYAALAFPLAAFIEWIRRGHFKTSHFNDLPPSTPSLKGVRTREGRPSGKRWWAGIQKIKIHSTRNIGIINYLVYALFALFIYYNLWWTYQVHGGGLIDYSNVTRAYFWKVVLRYKNNLPPDIGKLYDTDEYFDGKRKNVQLIYQNNFETDTTLKPPIPAIEGQYSEFVNKERQLSEYYEVPLQPGAAKWLRATATFHCTLREWDYWRTANFVVKFVNGDQDVKQRAIRAHRFLDNGVTTDIYIDTKLPKKPFTKVAVFVWNADSDKLVLVDNLRVETFDEE
jgi:hypothetical protein